MTFDSLNQISYFSLSLWKHMKPSDECLSIKVSRQRELPPVIQLFFMFMVRSDTVITLTWSFLLAVMLKRGVLPCWQPPAEGLERRNSAGKVDQSRTIKKPQTHISPHWSFDDHPASVFHLNKPTPFLSTARCAAVKRNNKTVYDWRLLFAVSPWTAISMHINTHIHRGPRVHKAGRSKRPPSNKHAHLRSYVRRRSSPSCCLHHLLYSALHTQFYLPHRLPPTHTQFFKFRYSHRWSRIITRHTQTQTGNPWTNAANIITESMAPWINGGCVCVCVSRTVWLR